MSRTLRNIPGISAVAQRWWISAQGTALRNALMSTVAPLHANLGSAHSSVDVPSIAEVAEHDPVTCGRGDEFSSMMSEWCDTSKFRLLGYQDVYARVVAHLRTRSPRVLEVGIGVNDPNSPSGMESSHQPGASLVGWAHYFPHAEVHGADIDRRVLIDSTQYKTHWVDQRDAASLRALALDVGSPIDLIVDDGLHTPEANGLTIMALLPHLASDGVFVVEDILPEYDGLWDRAQHWLRPEYGMAFFPGAVLRSVRNEGLAVLWRRR